MQHLQNIYTQHPTLSLIYIVGVAVCYIIFMFMLPTFIKYQGLDYKSGKYAGATAKQQNFAWRKKQIGLWLMGGLIAMPIMAIIWPITVATAIARK